MQRWDMVQIRLRPEVKKLFVAKAEAAGVPMSALVQYLFFHLPETREKLEEIEIWYEGFTRFLKNGVLSDNPPLESVLIEGEPGFEERMKEWGLE